MMLTGEHRLRPVPAGRSGPLLCMGRFPAKDKLGSGIGQMELGRGQGAALQHRHRSTLSKVSLKDLMKKYPTIH